MKINWFTVIAQVINFLILVWLLKRFLYKPILKAVDEREKKITSQLKDAKAEKAEAKKEQDEFAKKNDDFDQQKKALMDKAVADTNDEKNKLLEAARKEANDLQVKLEKAAKDVQEKMKERLVQKVQDEVFAISRKTLTDLASVSLEEQSANLFIKRLDELKDNEKKQFIDAFKADAKPVLIRSAFELPAKQQT
ncbi:MAG: F0F1 ATP synthase subunit B, partial [Chitinophagaceae bacterium]|nr:F0F1 ATP synthase subunit B [Chitinophagaceae bacterium]